MYTIAYKHTPRAHAYNNNHIFTRHFNLFVYCCFFFIIYYIYFKISHLTSHKENERGKHEKQYYKNHNI